MSQPDDKNATPPPAYFLSVSLGNVRCFGPEQTLDLSDSQGRPAQWTVILGDNGTGKTTLLQAIATLVPAEDRSGSLHSPEYVWSKYDRNLLGSMIKEARNESTLSCVLLIGSLIAGVLEGEFEEPPTSLHPAFIEGEPLVATRKVTVKGKRNSYVSSHEPIIAQSPKKDDSDNTNYVLDPELLWCYGYGASRRMGDSGLGGSGEAEVDKVESLFYDDVELPNAEEWLLRAEYAANKASESSKNILETRREKIIDILMGLLPDVESIRFSEPEDDPSWVPATEFRTPYGWVRIDQLSLGYRTMIAWTVDVARRMFQRYPDSPNPLAEPAVVLVDEIDLHLHPRWQRDIIPFLSERFPNTQFIVTAHSPLIVQAAQDANIAVLRREGDHVVIEQDLKPLRNLRIDQILTSDLYGLESARPPHLDELLEQRRTLLSKSSLTEGDRRRLKEIEEEIGDLPAGETPEEMEAMDIIRQAAERLKEDA